MPVYAKAIFGSFPSVQQVRVENGERCLIEAMDELNKNEKGLYRPVRLENGDQISTTDDVLNGKLARVSYTPFEEFELVSNSKGSCMEYENQEQSSKIMEQMRILRQTEELCDVELLVAGSVIRAHRYILAAASPYFKAMFTNGMVEMKKLTIELQDIPEESVRIIVDYIYTDKIAITMNNVHQLIFTATVLQMDVIVVACQQFLATMITSHNCMSLYHFSDIYNCTNLISSIEDFASSQFRCIRKSPEFNSISFHHLKSLLNRSDLNVSEEQDVFETIVQWVSSNPRDRQHHFVQLFKTLRLHLVGWNFLCEAVNSNSYVKNSQECREIISAMVLDAMTPSKRKHPESNHENTSEYSASMACPSLTASSSSSTSTFRKSVAGAIFCAGGRGKAGGPFSSVEAYDWRRNQWIEVPDMMSQRRHVGVVSANGNLYAIGGHDGTAHLATAEAFQPSIRQWKRIASMKTARRGIAVASIENVIYAVGGLDDTTCYKTVERYDIEEDEWSTVADMDVQRGGVGVAVIGRYLFAIGGNDGTSSLETCERFDPMIDKWKRIASMKNRRAGSGVCVLDGYLYAIGGFDDNAPLETCERYDPDADKWITLDKMSSPRGGVGVAALGGKVYAIGGHDGSDYLNTVECYDPIANRWQPAAEIKECRAGAGVAWANVRMHQLSRTPEKCDSGCAPSGGSYCI
ncbi:Kelch-like protein 8 [Caenorhabditis elegans]|uniref:Kelch-like protein 8 n=3 Tax=Caenorhabditis elegans TaxID=6239 RepID=KLHL8_CAEEL|nr:Kelch-like protein 8 [Caenorhabditis elegans]G5ED84.1 RecName: Full=Kelch-like protein 8 [Caenorhabditis elegans]ABC67522.1 KEL-8 [Caenorhabditis elegans]CCD74270.1 Kelch-like protein 8 [Caenorhabditis elegans]|eukprot:NP_503729.4 Kelch-like protein 8 [Caenorhabditis elegans]